MQRRGQERLLRLRSALGYSGLDPFSASIEGICRGVAQTAIAAFVLEKALQKEAKSQPQSSIERKNEFQRYLNRLDFIISHYDKIPALISSVKKLLTGDPTEDERMFIDVAALIESMQIYSYPDKYSEVFGRPLTQKDILELSYYAESQIQQLNPQNKMVMADSISGIYDKSELETYMRVLSDLVREHPCDLALAIDNDEHAISLFYDTQNNSWTIIDAENLEERSVLPEQLASRIATALPMVFDPVKVFNLKFFTSVNRLEETGLFINKLKSNTEFQKLHDLNAERAVKSDLKGISLAYLAASNNNIPMLEELSHFKNSNDDPLISFVQSTGDGTSPLFMAVQNGCVDAVRLILNQRNSIGERVVNCNELMKYKKTDWTPLYLAAQKNQAAIIEELALMRNTDGSCIVNFNQLVNGETALTTAIQYAPYALRALLNIEHPKGIRVVDVRQPLPDGRTPMLIAVTFGKVDALKQLCELRRPNAELEIDVNAPLQYGRKAIHIAAKEGYPEIISYLASRKDVMIDLNEPDKDGMTPAHHAASNGKVDVLSLLVKLGADVSKNVSGKRPIDMARSSNVFPFYEALEKKATIAISPISMFSSEQAPSIAMDHQLLNIQMELNIEDDVIEGRFESSKVIRLEKKSMDPEIWTLSLNDDFGKSVKAQILGHEFSDKLAQALKQKDLQTFLTLIESRPEKNFKKIASSIHGEIETQKYQQGNLPEKGF